MEKIYIYFAAQNYNYLIIKSPLIQGALLQWEGIIILEKIIGVPNL